MTPPPASPGSAQFRLNLTVERLPSGRLRFTSPVVPDWARAASGPQQIARAVTDLLQAAVVEAQIREYRTRRQALKHPTHNQRRTQAGATYQRFTNGDGRVVRRVGHDPHSWTEQPDGTWRSPSGRTYRADTLVVQRVRARQALTPGPAVPAPREGGAPPTPRSA